MPVTGPLLTDDGRVVVDVWSDIMCPYCYLGDALLARAADEFDQPVEIRYHAYQLMPDLPPGVAVDLTELLKTARGITPAQAETMHAQITERAAQIGLTYNLDKAVATNTRDAHRLTFFADGQGKQHEMVQRLFKAYFTDGLHIGDHAVLADLAAEIGLERDKTLEVLSSDAYTDDVDADIRLARQLGITGVPFFVFDGKYAVSGAQPVEAFTEALTTAWNEHGHSPA